VIYEDQTESGKTPRRNKTEINGIDSGGATDSRQKSRKLLKIQNYFRNHSANHARIVVNPDFSGIGYGADSKHDTHISPVCFTDM